MVFDVGASGRSDSDESVIARFWLYQMKSRLVGDVQSQGCFGFSHRCTPYRLRKLLMCEFGCSRVMKRKREATLKCMLPVI